MGLQYNERNVEMKNEECEIRNEKGNTFRVLRSAVFPRQLINQSTR